MTADQLQAVLRSFTAILGTAVTETPVIRPTMLFNEGWLLQLVLQAEADGIRCLPFCIPADARRYGEPLLSSPFHGGKPREGPTSADAAIGQFDFRERTKAGLRLQEHATTFEVVEAKLFSDLSPGINNAKQWYDQAARTVACIAWTAWLAGFRNDRELSLGFTFVAPASQIAVRRFTQLLGRDSISNIVGRRYRESSRAHDLGDWLQAYFEPVLSRIELRLEPWETVLDRIDAADPDRGTILRSFYEACLVYNRPAGRA
jgi:hypothetical protein